MNTSNACPFRLALCAASAACAIGALAGCKNYGPEGYNGGLIDPNTRTRADFHSPEADSVTLTEFGDDACQQLSAQLSRIPEIASSPSKVLIEMGSIKNMTRTPSSDFAAIQRRVFLALVNSDLARRSADIVEDVRRVDADAAYVSPPPQVDASGKEVPGSVPLSARYPLDKTYFLHGTFSELSRGGGIQSTYQFDFTLTNAQSRQIVFAKQITAKQFR